MDTGMHADMHASKHAEKYADTETKRDRGIETDRQPYSSPDVPVLIKSKTTAYMSVIPDKSPRSYQHCEVAPVQRAKCLKKCHV